MGLENEVIEVTCRNTDNFASLKDSLTKLGWGEVNFGFNLGRHSGAIDIQKGDKRCLIYRLSPTELQTEQLLIQHRIPCLGINHVCSNHERIAADIPSGARALDSMSFPDQQPQTGFIGSFEIMVGIARLLAKIYKATSLVPKDLKLNQLAFIPQEDLLIRLIPPVQLIPTSNWHIIANNLLRDIRNQDPTNKHTSQIDIFIKSFEDALTND